jgi:SAM-dependent methyltransferase
MLSKTGVESWDEKWAKDAGRADYLEFHPEVVALLPELRSRGARTALDLGCGVGRHSLFLAEAGFHVVAVDSSATGLEMLRETAAARNLTLELRQADADSLRYAPPSLCVVRLADSSIADNGVDVPIRCRTRLPTSPLRPGSVNAVGTDESALIERGWKALYRTLRPDAPSAQPLRIQRLSLG